MILLALVADADWQIGALVDTKVPAPRKLEGPILRVLEWLAAAGTGYDLNLGHYAHPAIVG